jgi:hypothetical protein
MTAETHDHTERGETMTSTSNPMSQKTHTHKNTAQVRSIAMHTITSRLRQFVSIHRAIAAMLLATTAAVSVLAGAASPVHADPTITAVLVGGDGGGTYEGDTFVANGNFALQGSGFTPGNTRVHVWLQDFTTNQLLWFTPEAYAFPDGRIGVTGPMQYSPPMSPPCLLCSAMWSPQVGIPCGHFIAAIAKDGTYQDQTAWTPWSDNISPPCPPPPR